MSSSSQFSDVEHSSRFEHASPDSSAQQQHANGRHESLQLQRSEQQAAHDIPAYSGPFVDPPPEHAPPYAQPSHHPARSLAEHAVPPELQERMRRALGQLQGDAHAAAEVALRQTTTAALVADVVGGLAAQVEAHAEQRHAALEIAAALQVC